MTFGNQWLTLLNLINNEQKDIGTFTLTKRKIIYFNVKVNDGNIVVNKSVNLKPSCKITSQRTINYKQFEQVYNLYPRYINKEKGIRKQMTLLNNNTTYIISIINAYHVYEESVRMFKFEA